MGMWAGIKHALNSTLGTETFKPLDRIMTDTILDNKSLAASDEIYYVIAAGEQSVELTSDGSALLSHTIRIRNSGSIRITVDLKQAIGGATVYSTFFYVMVNGIIVGTVSSDSENYETYSLDVSVPAGGTISFKISGYYKNNHKYARYRNLRMCAKVIDSSLFEVMGG